MRGMSMPTKPNPPATSPRQRGEAAIPAGHTHAHTMGMPATDAPISGMKMDGSAHHMHSSGALIPYSGQRESSGTAGQPDDTGTMSGPMLMSGGWMFTAHGTLNLVYDHQSEQRGDNKAFASGMLMGMARRPLGNGTFQFKAMLSPDENRELTFLEDGPAYRVGKISLGAVRDFEVAEQFSLSLGGLSAVNFVPRVLATDYGSRNPTVAMGFVRLKLH